jgi:sulfate transport system ATP-binding protein
VFEHPANDFVMRFLGHVNVLDAELADGHARIGEVRLAVGEHRGDGHGRVYVRPHDVEVARAPGDGTIPARVVRVTPLSGGLKVDLSVPALGSRLRADLDWERGTALGLRDGDDVFLSLRRTRVFVQGEQPATAVA